MLTEVAFYFFRMNFLVYHSGVLLKADGMPTIFLHNSQTIPKKYMSTVRRETKAAKQQVRFFSKINFASFLLSITFRDCFL